MTFDNKSGLWQAFLDRKEKAVMSKTLDADVLDFEKCRGENYDLTVGEGRHG